MLSFKNLGDIDLEDMKRDIEILVLKNTASQAEDGYKTATINLAESLENAEKLKDELDGRLTTEERNQKTVELKSLYRKIERDLAKWKKEATTREKA